jgi:hypothetical protein
VAALKNWYRPIRTKAEEHQPRPKKNEKEKSELE